MSKKYTHYRLTAYRDNRIVGIYEVPNKAGAIRWWKGAINCMDNPDHIKREGIVQ